MKKEKKRDGGVYIKWIESKWGRAVWGGLILNFLPFPSPLKINEIKKKFVNPSLNFVCVFNAHFLLGYLLSDINCRVIDQKDFSINVLMFPTLNSCTLYVKKWIEDRILLEVCKLKVCKKVKPSGELKTW